MRPPFTVEPIQQGAKDRVAQKLKDIDRIKKERPCTKCANYSKEKTIKCSSTMCDFYHNAFKPIEQNEMK